LKIYVKPHFPENPNFFRKMGNEMAKIFFCVVKVFGVVEGAYDTPGRSQYLFFWEKPNIPSLFSPNLSGIQIMIL